MDNNSPPVEIRLRRGVRGYIAYLPKTGIGEEYSFENARALGDWLVDLWEPSTSEVREPVEQEGEKVRFDVAITTAPTK